MVYFQKMKPVGNAKQLIQGISLIELMVILVLVLTLVGAAYPKLSEQYNRHLVFSSANKLFNFLKQARATAMSKSAYVTVCPSADLIACSHDWQKTIIAFIDETKSGQINVKEPLIFQFEANEKLSSNRAILHLAPIHIAGSTAATITLCSSGESSRWRRAIVISNMGRVRLELDSTKVKC